ncbi:myosin light chain kinase, smooth muscle-like [Anopheles marshallii]|uniref:myosin light chain kinase, smooth muscle-like n=1 Tax=Anopheles marshallii TaxID=1521116 RepID=UPI00237AF99F|nr:myosin light chain kinase, smooth muscle-like [Anopheles marshallii]
MTSKAENQPPTLSCAKTNSEQSGTVPLKCIYVPQKLEVYEYETAIFQCIIEGYPTPVISWQRNGNTLAPSRTVTIQSKGSLCTMKIQNIHAKDAGQYQLVIENESGRVERTIELLVLEKTRIINRVKRNSQAASCSIRIYRHINDYSPLVGEYIILNAEYYAPSTPIIRCFHNGRELEEGRIFHRSVSQRNLSLVLEKARASDSGTYTCVLETMDGSMKVMSAEIDVQDPKWSGPINKLPRIVHDLPKVITITEGSEVELSLELQCSEVVKCSWKKNGRIVKDSMDFAYIDHGNGKFGLRLKDPFLDDAGLYECVLETATQQLVSSCYLDVLELDQQQPLMDCDPRLTVRFVRFPLAQIALEGDNVEFYACVHPPDIRLRWFVRGIEITSLTKGFSMESHDDGGNILRIFNSTYRQSGEVKCCIPSTYTVSLGQMCAYADLCVLPKAYVDTLEQKDIKRFSVGQKLRFLHCLQDEVVLQGDHVVIEACYQGHPPSDLRWKRSGRTIVDSNVTTTNLPGRTRLLLTNIESAQGGKYSIQLDKACPDTELSMCLRVESPPEPPAGKPTATIVSQTALSVSWNPAPYDGGSAITGFVIEMEQNGEGEERWVCAKRVPNSFSCLLDTLQQDDSYRFRIRAENVHGMSHPTPASDLVKLSTGNTNGISELGVNNPVTSPISSGASICSNVDNGYLSYGDDQGALESNQHQHLVPSTVKFSTGGDFTEQFEVLREVGKGRFGVVYKVIARHGEAGTVLAAKKVKCIRIKDKERVWQETAIMESLEHPKLLRLFATFELPKEIIMVVEYISGGELFERVVADDFTLTEKDCIIFVRQICQGVEHMHSRQIVHLDLKPENIMCATKTSHEIKIIDFGLAQRLCASSPTRVLFGTPEFIAPEIINYEPISVQSDMWSIGVICYVLLSGLSPFMGDNDVDTFSNITRAEYDFDDEAFDLVSDGAKEFIAGLLRGRQEERLSAQKCLQSEWLSFKSGDNVGINQIRTDKLKKFIIRRKWQKTGNAIRALGRMANLSASRRVSVVPRETKPECK